jgi:RimJ/RimL family protein N-acetyltransferase
MTLLNSENIIKMDQIFETKRLIIKNIGQKNVEDLLELFEDPVAMKYLSGIKNREETEEWVSLVLESYKKYSFGPWAVILKDNNDFMGYCGLYMQENVDGRDEIELLYGLIRRYWGMGYATEAALGVYEYGKSELGITRFISLIPPGNTGSADVAEKIGMKLEKQTLMWGNPYDVYSMDEN